MKHCSVDYCKARANNLEYAFFVSEPKKTDSQLIGHSHRFDTDKQWQQNICVDACFALPKMITTVLFFVQRFILPFPPSLSLSHTHPDRIRAQFVLSSFHRLIQTRNLVIGLSHNNCHNDSCYGHVRFWFCPNTWRHIFLSHSSSFSKFLITKCQTVSNVHYPLSLPQE